MSGPRRPDVVVKMRDPAVRRGRPLRGGALIAETRLALRRAGDHEGAAEFMREARARIREPRAMEAVVRRWVRLEEGDDADA